MSYRLSRLIMSVKVDEERRRRSSDMFRPDTLTPTSVGKVYRGERH
jgi:hypothetical protein